MRIAVDVLGGDHAPEEILRGVAVALGEGFRPAELLLVGPPRIIEETLGGAGIERIPEILPTEEVVEAGEKPVIALRRKPRASVALCVAEVAAQRADGVLSFGNTGAAVAAAMVTLGLLPGIRRPGILVTLSGAQGRFALLDAGANPQPKPLHLFQYGVMGAAYAKDLLRIEQPRVGLLNIGGEAGKGSPIVREAHGLLQQSGLNFIGNVEGQDLFHGVADVLVTDGFVGNMLLKVVEGFVSYLLHDADDGSVGSLALKDTFRRLVGAADFAEIGGATLLGVDGSVFIGHGRSRSNAVLPALRALRADIQAGVNRHITESLKRRSHAAGLSGNPEPAS